MEYNLNLNEDKINCFGPKSNLNEGEHMARHGPHIQLKLKLGQKGELGKKSPFSWFDQQRERIREKQESQRLHPKIYGAPLVGFHPTKNESSLHRRGVHVGT